MGMSVVARGSESSACVILRLGNEGRNWSGPLRLPSFYLSIFLEPLESFFAAELRLHPIQRSLLCQAGANGWYRFATTLGNPGYFAVGLLVGGFNVFGCSDAIEQQLGFDVLDVARMLAPAHGAPFDVDGAGIDSLGG